MAIIIPSKHIYEPPQNAKIRDNLIDKIEVESKKVKPKNDYKVNVYNTKIEQGFYNIDILKDWKENIQGVSTKYVAYVQVTPKQVMYTIHIPKKIKNGYINKIHTSVDKDGIPDIKFSLYGKIEKGTATGTGLVEMNNIQLSTPTETYNDYYTLPTNVSVSNTIYAEANVAVPIYGNLASVSVVENYEEYYFNIRLICGMEAIKLTGTGTSSINHTGTYERYTPTFADVTILGDTIGIDFETDIITIGNADGTKPDSFESNELLQDSNYIKENSSNKNAITSMFTDTLNHFTKGKETAELLCSISEYYEENGNLAISTESNNLPMIFHQYDKVIPMIMNAERKDEPMSKNKDGTAKVFQVLSTKVYYDGAVWQKLFLQEA